MPSKLDYEMLTAIPGRCSHPLCKVELEGRKDQRTCSERCRLTLWALLKVARLLAPLGKERAWEVLRKVSRA